ncbi:hypothetical protein ACJQWK_01911 [Exserohilum turcicum]
MLAAPLPSPPPPPPPTHIEHMPAPIHGLPWSNPVPAVSVTTAPRAATPVLSAAAVTAMAAADGRRGRVCVHVCRASATTASIGTRHWPGQAAGVPTELSAIESALGACGACARVISCLQLPGHWRSDTGTARKRESLAN